MPRHGANGIDLGGAIFQWWKRHSESLGRPIAAVFFELESGARLEFAHARSMIHTVLTKVGVTNSELASTYSMRRGSATLCATWDEEAERSANGFWLSKRNTEMICQPVTTVFVCSRH